MRDPRQVQALNADPTDASVFMALLLNPHPDQPHVIKQPQSQHQESLVDGLTALGSITTRSPSIHWIPRVPCQARIDAATAGSTATPAHRKRSTHFRGAVVP